MKKKKSTNILKKALSFGFVIVIIKMFLFHYLFQNKQYFSFEMIESSDIIIVFTGAFFVLGMMLAGTLTDYKEGERIPGDIASHLESIQDWVILAFRNMRDSDKNEVALKKDYIRDELNNVTN
ncbi:MAG: hypothetical protein WCJ33_10305, partial [Pseudomonadota bacterium]